VPAFARHETFHFREGWLRKGLLAIKKDSDVFVRPEATDMFGLGKNMVTALRYWLQATRLAVSDGNNISPSSLAKLILRCDPYLEDEGTLWAIHMELAGNLDGATAWYFLFNHYPFVGFDQESFVTHLSRFIFQRGLKQPKASSLEKDFRCIVRTYTGGSQLGPGPTSEDALDCPLAVLGLMGYLPNTKSYRFLTPSLKRLPTLIVVYCIYRLAAIQAKPVLRLEECTSVEQGPGRLLRLDTDSLYSQLERVEAETGGKFVRVSRTAGLNTVSVYDRYRPLDILERYYQSRSRKD
jgi:Protein of unknown function (DUF4007)